MTNSRAIDALVRDVAARLDAISQSPRLDAEILLGRAIDMPRSYLFAHPEDVPDRDALDRLEHTVARRLAGEPMAYITGSKEFWSTELMVTPATLVPRPETELLVAAALAEIPRDARWRILDLGTGCGAIAVILARERPRAEVTAIDQSDAALKVAMQNARQLDIGNVNFLQGNWTEPVRGKTFDLIVSNPPYISDADPALAQLQREPQSALVSGRDGLQAIRQLARDCLPILVAGGTIMLEHGADQENALADILDAEGWLARQCHQDYAGVPRLTIARKPAL